MIGGFSADSGLEPVLYNAGTSANHNWQVIRPMDGCEALPVITFPLTVRYKDTLYVFGGSFYTGGAGIEISFSTPNLWRGNLNFYRVNLSTLDLDTPVLCWENLGNITVASPWPPLL